MKVVFIILILMLTTLFGYVCSQFVEAETDYSDFQPAVEPTLSYWRLYCIRHWLTRVMVHTYIPLPYDPNQPPPDLDDPSNWEIATYSLPINFRTMFNRNDEAVARIKDLARERIHPDEEGPVVISMFWDENVYDVEYNVPPQYPGILN